MNENLTENFNELRAKLHSTCPVYNGGIRAVEGVYCRTPEDLELYLAYEKASRTVCYGYTVYCDINKYDDFHSMEFRGEDWYFFKGSPGDRDGPGDWWFETLTEIKAEIESFWTELEELKTNWTGSEKDVH